MEPYKEKKRERRIRDRVRMIQHGKEIYYIMYSGYISCLKDVKHFHHEAEMWGRKFHNNLKACSCDICCNPRRSPFSKEKHRITIQERKALEIDKDYESSKD